MVTIHEAILDYMILSQNDKQTGYPQLRKVAEMHWYALFKKTRESLIKKWYDIVNGVMDMPASCELVLGVYDVDSCGELAAYYADDFKNIIPRPAKKCKCNQCDIDECMCGTIQESSILEDVIFNSEIYQNKTFIRVLKNGQVVEHKEMWVPSYGLNGSLQGIEMVPSQITRCSLDVKSCGCISHCEENIKKLNGCGCVSVSCAPYMRDRYPALYNKNGYYKVDYTTKKIHIFDSRGRKTNKKNLLLFFESNGADMLIPDYARLTFTALLNWGKLMYSPLSNPGLERAAMKKYIRQKNEMIKFLNPIPFERMTQGESYFGSNSAYKNNSMGNNTWDNNGECCEQETECKSAEPIAITKTVTQIVQTNAPILPIVGIVGEGGPDDPTPNQSIFQSDKLKGLGGVNGRLRAELGGTPIYSFGENKSFEYDPVAGQVNLDYNSSGNVFPAGATWFVDRNQ